MKAVIKLHLKENIKKNSVYNFWNIRNHNNTYSFVS